MNLLSYYFSLFKGPGGPPSSAHRANPENKLALRRVHAKLLRALSRWDLDSGLSRHYVQEALNISEEALKGFPELYLPIAVKLTEADRAELWGCILDWLEAESAWKEAKENPNSPEYELARKKQVNCNMKVQKVLGMVNVPATLFNE